MPPTVPFNHYKSPRNQQNKTFVLFYYPMLKYSRLGYACFEHSNFLKVKDEEKKEQSDIIANTTPLQPL